MKNKFKFLCTVLIAVLMLLSVCLFAACSTENDGTDVPEMQEPENKDPDKDKPNTNKPDTDKPDTPVTPVLPESVPKVGWENVEDNLDGWEMYDLERFPYENFNAVRVINKGDSISEGDCMGMNIKSYRYLMFTLVNESDAIEVRFEVKKENTVAESYKSAITAGYPESCVTIINNEYNAAVVKLEAYQMVSVVLEIDESVETDQIIIFAGSMMDVNVSRCRFIISDIKGIVNTEFSEAETYSVPTSGWTDISTEDFDGNEAYTVSYNNGLTISHAEQMEAWSTAQMTLLKNYGWMKFTVTNNGNYTAKLRIDVKKKTEDTTLLGMVEQAYPANYATVNKYQNSLGLTIPAGETVDITVKLEAKYFDWLVVFFDSFDTAYNAPSGSITIKNFKGIIDESIEHRDPNALDQKNLAFKASNNVYQLNKNEWEATNSLNVTYKDISYGSYYYIRSDIEQFASEYNTFTFTVTNNGPQEVQMRIGITRGEKYYDEMRENINVCNYDQAFGSTTYQDGRGGTYTAVGSNQTVTVTIKYKPEEVPKQLIIYFDSCKKDATELRSGNLTLRDFYFSFS